MFKKLEDNNYKKESLESYKGMLKIGNTYKLKKILKYFYISKNEKI